MARYGFASAIGRAIPTDFPLATLLVNILGSLAMGLLIGFLARTTPSWQVEARLFLAVGVLGGFTTFSAFSLDAMTLIQRGQWGSAMFYALVSVLASVAGLYAGLLATRVVAA